MRCEWVEVGTQSPQEGEKLVPPQGWQSLGIGGGMVPESCLLQGWL